MKPRILLTTALCVLAVFAIAGCTASRAAKPAAPIDNAVPTREPTSAELFGGPITEDTIRARYEKMLKENTGQPEYRTSHILVVTEAEAAAILIDLAHGKSFKQLAHEKSIDPSARNGGDLGWSVARIFPGDFSQAIRTMNRPGMYPKPVQTPWGWHVISVEAIRTYEPPSYELFRSGIEALMSKDQSR